jgi:metallo-beta-lactamase class B
VTTPGGIIVIDPLFEYSVEAAIGEGLASLGLDPVEIRYVIVSHGHRDHVGGARYLQDTYGARVVMAREDWDLLEGTGGDWPKPVRDIEAYDGFELELGGVTLTLHATPGHTPGTVSTIIPVSDGEEAHVAALWGGTAFNFIGDDDEARWFQEYVASAERFTEIARAAGADVILSNHPQYDGSTTKLPALADRRPGEPHPYVIGTESVARYLTVAAECARAGLAGEA